MTKHPEATPAKRAAVTLRLGARCAGGEPDSDAGVERLSPKRLGQPPVSWGLVLCAPWPRRRSTPASLSLVPRDSGAQYYSRVVHRRCLSLPSGATEKRARPSVVTSLTWPRPFSYLPRCFNR